jgi:hypothetical protein
MTSQQFTTIRVARVLDDLCAVYDAAVAKAADDSRWMAALDKAWGWLLAQDSVEYRASDHALKVESNTEPGRVYVSNGSCQCHAYDRHNACWHRAAARLVRRAWELADARETADLAAALLDDAQAAGATWYTADIAKADAHSRRRSLEDYATEWDTAAERQRTTAVVKAMQLSPAMAA